ncbi:MAG: IS21 family transposase [Oscillospiraceae bacterium]|nr:IS21 family transposase [Oscillospiraceae bacterium]
MIDWDTYARVRKCKVDGVTMRRCAEALGISRNTVKRYWDGNHTPDDKKDHPATVDSPEKLAIMEAIAQYFEENKDAPKKQAPNAKTAWVAIRDRFSVGESTVRKYVSELKAKQPEAFIPLDFEPGEVLQVDWCEIKAVIDGYAHKVPVFCAALPYSYAIFIAVLPNMTMESFFEGLMMAMEWFNGSVERIFFDNLKTAVLSGAGKNAVMQERFRAFEAHYSFEAVFMNKNSGNEKGAVENLCGLCRGLAFTPMPNAGSLKELQDHVLTECSNYLKFHKVKDRPRPVRVMFEEERPALRPLPSKRIEPAAPVEALVAHDLTFRYDATKYSLPMEYVGKTITVRARAYSIEAWFGGNLVFTHTRPFVKGKHQYIPEHYLPLLEKKQRAMRNAAPLKYGVLPPQLEEFRRRCSGRDKFEQLANVLMLGRNVSSDELLQAVECANMSGRPTYSAVCRYLKLKEESFEVIGIPIVDEIKVEHADLSQYDTLLFEKEGDR